MRILAVELFFWICASATGVVLPDQVAASEIPAPKAHGLPEYAMDRPADPQA